MIKGLSTAGLGDVKDVEELITLAADNGFGAIETSGPALRAFISDKGLENAKSIMEQQNITIGSMNLPVEWRGSEETFQEGLAALVEDAKTAQTLGCTDFCTYVLPATDEKAAHFMAVATKRIRLCAQILKTFGIHLGLEFVGPHHLRTTWKNPFIWTMGEMLDWIDAIAESNVGLLLDSYHWYTTGGTREDLLALKPSDITYVHLNDAKDVPVEDALDNDRLYPGEGVIDLVTFLKTLDEIGYTGVVAQEVLTQEAPTASPAELAKKSGDAFNKVFQQL